VSLKRTTKRQQLFPVKLTSILDLNPNPSLILGFIPPETAQAPIMYNASTTCCSSLTITKSIDFTKKLSTMSARQGLLAKALSEQGGGNRPASVPPPSSPSRIGSPLAQMHTSSNNIGRPASIPPSLRNKHSSHPSESSIHEGGSTSLDLMDLLQRSESSVVKARSGSVLSRGFILKTDHYPSGEPPSIWYLRTLIGLRFI